MTTPTIIAAASPRVESESHRTAVAHQAVPESSNVSSAPSETGGLSRFFHSAESYQARHAEDQQMPWAIRPPRAGSFLSRSFEDGASASFWIGLGAMANTSAAMTITEGVLRKDHTEIAVGIAALVVGSFDWAVAEAKSIALVRDLGDYAPTGLVGPHTATQLAYIGGGTLYTWGVEDGTASLRWTGLGILAGAWLASSVQLNRIFEAMDTGRIRLEDTPHEESPVLHPHHTHDVVGNPWAVILMLLGSHGAGEAMANNNAPAAFAGCLVSLIGLELAHGARQHDTLFWLALSGAAAGVLGYTMSQDALFARLSAGVVLGVGALHNLYFPTAQPQLQSSARRRFCPILVPAMD